MKYESKLIIRILSLFIIILLPEIFYTIFTTLTIYPVYLILKLLQYNPELVGNSMLINSIPILFVPACIAASAYGLLTILILITKDIKLEKIVKMLSLGYLLILLTNIIRITILLLILINFSSNLFETVHMFFWRIVVLNKTNHY